MTAQNLSPTHEATIDGSILETLRAYRKEGDPDPCIRLINIFLSISPNLLKTMHAALQTEDSESLAKAAHSLKSSSLNMGATALGELCASLEIIGKCGTTAETGDLFARAELEYAAVAAAFTTVVSENED
ncbi:MAG: Hpt domain-containing protein [Deltaproteobacteria bacterium]|nr:Hpt domain-containing protein [Deltaproteobacteria bacterium]